jgi:glycosyltransferase involved in cell wall biosynthesis
MARSRPRVLFVARTRYALPLSDALARKWDALAEELDLRVLARGSGNGDARFALRLPANGVACQLALAGEVARELQELDPDAVLAQGPFDAAAALHARSRTGWHGPVVSDVHGDWRASTRLYGNPVRGIISLPLALAARRALRRVDGVRTLSAFTTGLVERVGVEPLAEFPAYVDLDGFEAPRMPLPARPQAVFVGVLEPYKGLRTLRHAWDAVRAVQPHARLVVVGRGHAAQATRRFVAHAEGSVEWRERLAQDEVAQLLDESTCLVLPSQSEGLPRIVMEAFCRGRSVVATAVGGVPDLVRDGDNGLLVPRANAGALGAALVRVLGDPAEAARLAVGAAATSGPWHASPEEFARRTRVLVERALAGRQPRRTAVAAP